MTAAKGKMLAAMGIFGTVGIFVRYLPLSSPAIAFCRAVLGLVFLLIVMAVSGKRLAPMDIKKNLLVLCASGVALGGNWILLFEAYRYTTVAVATACYYLAPLFLLLASPLLGERLTARKLLCVGVALVGMVLVSGVLHSGMAGLTGVLLATGAAVLYASVMLLNKKLKPIAAYDKTVVQLGAAAVVIGPYLLLTEGFAAQGMGGFQWLLLLVVGIVHTGVAYTLYFDSIRQLPSQTVAIFSYLDPVIAIVLSAVLLQEKMDVASILGSILILGSALYSELPTRKK